MNGWPFTTKGVSEADVKDSEKETPNSGASRDVPSLVKIGRLCLWNATSSTLGSPSLNGDPDEQTSEGGSTKHHRDESPKRLRTGKPPDQTEESVDRVMKADSHQSADQSAQDAEGQKALLVIQPVAHPLGKAATFWAGELGHGRSLSRATNSG